MTSTAKPDTTTHLSPPVEWPPFAIGGGIGAGCGAAAAWLAVGLDGVLARLRHGGVEVPPLPFRASPALIVFVGIALGMLLAIGLGATRTVPWWRWARLARAASFVVLEVCLGGVGVGILGALVGWVVFLALGGGTVNLPSLGGALVGAAFGAAGGLLAGVTEVIRGLDRQD